MDMQKLANSVLTNQIKLYLYLAAGFEKRVYSDEAIEVLVKELNTGLVEEVFRIENKVLIMETDNTQIFMGSFGESKHEFNVVALPQINEDILQAVNEMLHISISRLYLIDQQTVLKKEAASEDKRHLLFTQLLELTKPR